MPRSVAINVGANTNEPGFRGPVYADGTFEFIPIPEPEPTAVPVPTYADLPLSFDLPADVRDVPVHLDPEFAGYGPCDAYTYGDPHAVKARPLSELSAGDHVFFYATLDARGDTDPAPWITPGWGAYLIGRFELARDPVTGDQFAGLPDDARAALSSNAHHKRDPFDAAVLLAGDPDGSTLYERAVPLSAVDGGTVPNRIVTELSSDSGRGPWWRRPLRFDAAATAALRRLEGADDATMRRYARPG